MQVEDFIRHLVLELQVEQDGRHDDPTTARALQCVRRAVVRASEAAVEERKAREYAAYKLRQQPRCPICGTSPPCESDCR